MKTFFSTILYSWGSDTPPEVIWGLNNLLTWAKSKGFKTHLCFEESVQNDNETLVKELSDFFEEKMK